MEPYRYLALPLFSLPVSAKCELQKMECESKTGRIILHIAIE
jgi:hypothetical protein